MEAGALALPLAVFEDRGAAQDSAGPLQVGRECDESLAAEQAISAQKVNGNKQEARKARKRKQPEDNSMPKSLAGSVMMLRSQHSPASSVLPVGTEATIQYAQGPPAQQQTPDGGMAPPSPDLMQILGKSRGLKRDPLEPAQLMPTLKKSKIKSLAQKAPVVNLTPPLPAGQPVGSNWWAQVPPGPPMQTFNQQAAIQQPASWEHSSPYVDACAWGSASQQQQQSAPWPLPPNAAPKSAMQAAEAYPRGPASQHEQQAAPWPLPPNMTNGKSQSQAPVADWQEPRQHHSHQPSMRAQMPAQKVQYHGRSQGGHMRDLVGEVLAYDVPACWGNGNAQQQQYHGAGPLPKMEAGGDARLPNMQPGQGPRQPGQWWPAPDGGRFVLDTRPKKQQAKKAKQDKQPQQAVIAQQDTSSEISDGQSGPVAHSAAMQEGLQQLHREVERFAQLAAPTVAEVRAVQEAQSIITETALGIWPECNVGSFGSQANATALPGSDIDITILGVMDFDGATGIKRNQREAVKAELQKLLKALRKRGAVPGKALVITARVPIIKCNLAVKGLQIPADISLGVANGLSAVAFVEQQVLAIGPSMKALAVVLKALLQQAGLNERVAGGLGSYTLLNLVMAHVMSQGVNAQSEYNLGQLLLSFLNLFGNTFSYQDKAVSVRAGGIVKKERHFRQRDKPHLLTVEDPQQPGTDIGSGAYNISQVAKALSRAHAKLAQKADSWRAGDGLAGQPMDWAAVQAEGQDSSVAAGCNVSFPLLSSIMDPGLALGRSAQAAQARAEHAKKSLDKVVKKAATAPRKRRATIQSTHTHFIYEDSDSDFDRSQPPSKKRLKQMAWKKKMAGKGKPGGKHAVKNAKRKGRGARALAQPIMPRKARSQRSQSTK